MHLEILDKKREKLLYEIPKIIKDHCGEFYLAGGTALSLQLGLRKSKDFDFFTRESFDEKTIFDSINEKYGSKEIINNRIEKNNFDVKIDGVQVSLFKYDYPMYDDLIKTEIKDLMFASIRDIAAMKMSAIGSRGAKKDFFDLYFILKNKLLKKEEIEDILKYKYGNNTDFAYMYMGLSYFDDADKQELDKTFVKYNWDDIKKYFIALQGYILK